MSDATALSSPLKIRWFFWTFLALLLFVVIGVYSSRMANNATDYDLKRAMDRYETLNKLRQTETATLTTADWVDQDKKIVRIPIDEAVVKEIDILKAKPAAQGCVIPGTTPAPAPTSMNAAPAAATPAASGATNAAPATPSPASASAPAKPTTPASTNAAPAAPAKPAPSTNAAPAAPPKPASDAPVRTTRTY